MIALVVGALAYLWQRRRRRLVERDRATFMLLAQDDSDEDEDIFEL